MVLKNLIRINGLNAISATSGNSGIFTALQRNFISLQGNSRGICRRGRLKGRGVIGDWDGGVWVRRWSPHGQDRRRYSDHHDRPWTLTRALRGSVNPPRTTRPGSGPVRPQFGIEHSAPEDRMAKPARVGPCRMHPHFDLHPINAPGGSSVAQSTQPVAEAQDIGLGQQTPSQS